MAAHLESMWRRRSEAVLTGNSRDRENMRVFCSPGRQQAQVWGWPSSDFAGVMLCSLTRSLLAAASDSISGAVQLEPSITPARQWHFNGMAALKFAEGRGREGLEGCEGSIVPECAHLTLRNTLAVPTRSDLTRSRNGQV